MGREEGGEGKREGKKEEREGGREKGVFVCVCQVRDSAEMRRAVVCGMCTPASIQSQCTRHSVAYSTHLGGSSRLSISSTRARRRGIFSSSAGCGGW